MVRTVAIIQARMSSTRLPGKVLHEIAGRSMIEWVVTRVLRAGQLDEVVVATSRDAGDDVLAEHCAHLGAPSKMCWIATTKPHRHTERTLSFA